VFHLRDKSKSEKKLNLLIEVEGNGNDMKGDAC
jgi:hypothetical protein